MMDADKDTWLEHDLFNVAIHEAGHLIVALHFGVDGWIEIERNECADYVNEKTIIGRMRHSPITDSQARRLVGIAGVVAEAIADTSEPFDAHLLLDYIECDTMELSQTDRDSAGEITVELLEKCADIILERWSWLCDLASEAVQAYGQATDARPVCEAVVKRLEALSRRDMRTDEEQHAREILTYAGDLWPAAS